MSQFDSLYHEALQAERDRLRSEVAWLRALVDRLTGGPGPDTGTAGCGAKLPPMLPTAGGSVSGTVTTGPASWTLNTSPSGPP